MSKLAVVLMIGLVGIVAAGCGGGDDQATAASGQAGGGSDTINVSDSGSLGKILVDSKGRTLYLFQKDTGTKSTCSGACAAEWPPVTTTNKPTTGDGLTASMVGTTTRSDGTKQVTYSGHPLYLYSGDNAAGDTKGQGLNFFGGLWYAVSTSGNANTTHASSSGGGYSY
jgi:predicted lipoprotein with Yx(FWY)xxD motif